MLLYWFRPKQTSPTFHHTSCFCHVWWNVGMLCAIKEKEKKKHVGWCWMKFVPEQNFIQHASTQKYEFSILDWFGRVFYPTFINFRSFRMFARSNCNSNFLMCFQVLNFVSIANIYCAWGRQGTRPCITAVLQDHVLLIKFLTIFQLPIYNSFVHEIVFKIVSNCFSRNRWIVPTSWNLKRIEWIRGNIITPLPF